MALEPTGTHARLTPRTHPLPRAQWAIIGGLLLLLALVQVRQPYPDIAPLHHLPTLALLQPGPSLGRGLEELYALLYPN